MAEVSALPGCRHRRVASEMEPASLEADAVIAVMAAIADRKDSRASAPLWHVRHLSVC